MSFWIIYWRLHCQTSLHYAALVADLVFFASGFVERRWRTCYFVSCRTFFSSPDNRRTILKNNNLVISIQGWNFTFEFCVPGCTYWGICMLYVLYSMYIFTCQQLESVRLDLDSFLMTRYQNLNFVNLQSSVNKFIWRPNRFSHFPDPNWGLVLCLQFFHHVNIHLYIETKIKL